MPTTKLCVLGHPVGHSLSPVMHNAALRELGLDWDYCAIDVVPERFAARVRALPGEGFVGANVTVPHKLAALDLADEASERARGVGAANTLVFSGGKIRADNTDVPGLLWALGTGGMPDVGGRSAIVLGAGGAGRAAGYALVGAGASPVYVWNRTQRRAEELAQRLSGVVPGAEVRAVPAAAEVVGDVDLLVNTTAVGMGATEDSTRHELEALGLGGGALQTGDALVADMVYRPGGTALTAEAVRHGHRAVDGLSILVGQGAVSLEIWTERAAPVELMERIVRSQAGVR